ncbi:glycosyltransferase family 2 protein [Candidatus Sumerlaeota bacterium]|nr:glycosyltransferase family 2 protein [Candidatus Sumerlaeota bacterium]
MSATVTVIIPVYNEPLAPEALVGALRDALGSEAEILLVDDGSDTPLGEIDGARLLRLPQNRGYGAAIKAGLAASGGERVVIIDADGTYPVEAVPTLLARLDDHEMAVGARTGANVRMSLARRLVKGVLTMVAGFLAEQRIPDINSGLRAFRRESAAPYLRLLPNRFSLTTTLTLAFLCDGRPVHFEPIDYHPRVGKSHWRPVRDTRDFILTILRTIFLFNPMRVCLPLALVLWLVAAGVLVGSAVWGDRIMDGTVSVLALGGLQILVVGLLAEVIGRRE